MNINETIFQIFSKLVNEINKHDAQMNESVRDVANDKAAKKRIKGETINDLSWTISSSRHHHLKYLPYRLQENEFKSKHWNFQRFR